MNSSTEININTLSDKRITVSIDGAERYFTIQELRASYNAGVIPGDLLVVVHRLYIDAVEYRGEATVESIVLAWEAAPLEAYEKLRVSEMISEFSFPDYAVESKAEFSDLQYLHSRCDLYYRHIRTLDKEFKTFKKASAKDLVLWLDERSPGWDAADGDKRFAEQVKINYPRCVRTDSEKKAKKAYEKQKRLEYAERMTKLETRNRLTEFPHKALPVELMGYGIVQVKDIKGLLRSGAITTETPTRYREDLEWMELSDFVYDWTAKKATAQQISYLKALYRQHKISSGIPIDISREDISGKIDALAPKY